MARILVVDDEPDLRFILRRTFERAGHQVVDVGNGAAAMAIVSESAPVNSLTGVVDHRVPRR